MPLLILRQLHQYGSSVALTIPKPWLRYYGLEAGDMIEIVIDGNLTIRPIRPPGFDERADARGR